MGFSSGLWVMRFSTVVVVTEMTLTCVHSFNRNTISSTWKVCSERFI